MSRLVLALAALLVAPACSDDSAPGGTGSIKGSVRDKTGKAVGEALIKVGALSTKASFSGAYELKDVPAGAATLEASADWFTAKQESVTVKAGEALPLDLQLDELALKLDPADQALADSYNKTYDWTKGGPSLRVLCAPTRRCLDNAIYLHNPAQYRDTSGEPALTPSPQPTIEAGGAKSFTFPISGGGEALELTSIVDTFAQTGLPATTADEAMLWTPMVNWLSEEKRGLDATLLNKIRAVGTAVAGQGWGSSSLRPQQIEGVYLVEGVLWVKVVFEGFVQLGAGISDDDGDGRKEVFAKVSAAQYSKTITDLLANEYVKTRLGTLALKTELSAALNELYTSTNLQIVGTVGKAYELAGVGSLKYPFVVHEQTDQKGKKIKGALLVGP